MIKATALDIILAWLFGRIPEAIQEDIERKHPDWIVVGFRRGTSINLPDQDPHSSFVAIPELVGWGEMRKRPPGRRRRVRTLRPAWGGT